MVLRFMIETKKKKEVRKGLDLMCEQQRPYNAMGLGSSWREMFDGRIKLEMFYPRQNFVSDKIVIHELTKTLKKIDKDIRIKRVRK